MIEILHISKSIFCPPLFVFSVLIGNIEKIMRG
jgi:hypothetical protein